MIYVPLQDLHLVQSMDWIGELSRRYHSVRMHILTPYGEVFPTHPVGNESAYRRKGRGLALPFFSFRFLFLASWVLGCVGFPYEQKKRSKSDFWEAH